MRKPIVRSAALLTAVLLACLLPLGAAAADNDYILYDDVKMPIPKSFVPERAISMFGEDDGFDQPCDLFVDGNDDLYVADTGNNRIVHLDKAGTLKRILTVDEAHTPLSGPQGVFVADNGHVYIADTGNNRVVHLNAAGVFVEQFTQPDSPLFEADAFGFAPTGVIVDSLNYVNILNGQDTHGIVRLSSDGEFVGYLGGNKTKSSLWTSLLRFVLSEEQLDLIGQNEPPYFSNFFLDDQGYIYTTTVYADTDQIKRHNTVGVNIYPSGQYAEVQSYNTLNGVSMGAVYGMLGDITVDENGIVTVVDTTMRYVYQYDPEGRMICRFGGRGDVMGSFEYPVSVATDSEGLLYVLDRDYNTIQCLRPTVFIQSIHDAQTAYEQGQYDQATVYVDQVLAENATYVPAILLKGKLYYKEGEWEKSMEMFEKADQYEGYSDAFSEYRSIRYRQYFVPIIIGAALLLTLVVVGAFRLSKQARKYIYEGTTHGHD